MLGGFIETALPTAAAFRTTSRHTILYARGVEKLDEKIKKVAAVAGRPPYRGGHAGRVTLPGEMIFHSGDHAVDAMLELAEVVHGHAMTGGNFGSGLFFQRIFAVCGDSPFL